MAISDLPTLSILRTKMQWHQERQGVLAENVSNSNTPNFKPRDLVDPKFEVGSGKIDGGATTYVIYFHTSETPATVVSGFTFINGSGNFVGPTNYCPGNSGDIVSVSLSYQWPLFAVIETR